MVLHNPLKNNSGAGIRTSFAFVIQGVTGRVLNLCYYFRHLLFWFWALGIERLTPCRLFRYCLALFRITACYVRKMLERAKTTFPSNNYGNAEELLICLNALPVTGMDISC
jgi:hypothetical protein